ncbi:Mitochondrial import inner membrane translocase subunit tim23 [Mitosporidium daphniae]|uniref:Tim17 domain-containing protein n=1 Tax=Mitosporidium daphniae TaxID=1485682 RepID=A0A098VRL4_9MICR|nr:Tim17 domain-containing protein [Mitosporidium daphniae]KGG51434.1 Tim17 domain-containing protein [Mitosporidium daphniae]|eukprot:XP_013237861.1 Tim17 domain-containing protein [Mitosporidium daphniae]
MSLFTFGSEASMPGKEALSDAYAFQFARNQEPSKTESPMPKDQIFTIKDMMDSLGMAPTKAIAKSDSALEYLFEDDEKSNAPRQSFGSRLAYGTGITYFSGLMFGGLWGFSEGFLLPGKHSTKMRWNMILNSCTRRGPFLANNLGLIALFYNGFHGGLLKALDQDSNVLTTAGCASLAGAIVRSPAGAKPALVAGVVTGSVMALFDITRNFSYYSEALNEIFSNKAT